MTTFTFIAVSLSAFVISALLGPVLIPVLHRLKFGQEIREIGPSWHKKKTGTPTMGGFIFIIPVILVILLYVRYRLSLLLLIFSLAFGAIGFVDDFIKVILKRNLGLTEKQKALLQILCALAFVFVIKFLNIGNSEIIIPFADAVKMPFILYAAFVLFVIVGTTNSVNLTDGVDGLASSVTLVVCLFLSLVALRMRRYEVLLFCLANACALIGFLMYNRHPAKVFMGDTGSLYLGGVVCFAAIILKIPLILIIAGGVYVFETLSVIIQVTSFKLTGKRVFKMSPFHHHLEMCGWSEKKIVVAAVIVTVLLCTLAYFMIF